MVFATNINLNLLCFIVNLSEIFSGRSKTAERPADVDERTSWEEHGSRTQQIHPHCCCIRWSLYWSSLRARWLLRYVITLVYPGTTYIALYISSICTVFNELWYRIWTETQFSWYNLLSLIYLIYQVLSDLELEFCWQLQSSTNTSRYL